MKTKLPGTRVRRAKVGDYVLASWWYDCDPQAPWYVGYVCRVLEIWKPEPGQANLYYNIGSEDGTCDLSRYYRYCRLITKEEGAEWLGLYGV